MIDHLGSVSLIAAVGFAAYGAIAGGVAGKLRSAQILKTAERSVIAFWAMISVAIFSVEYLILTNNFHIAYVAEHSNRDLRTLYKVAALWSGQEGSLLFWTWLLSIYALIVVLMNRKKNRQLLPYVVAISMGVGTFFSLVTLLVANPFMVLSLTSAHGLQAYTPADGGGLNPALQYPSMAIHPPMLYLGYVGMVIPFAFAMSALITRQPGDHWIRVTRRWAMVPWMFLGFGIILGGNWAYFVLGWGGYWGWDPVENASLLPWLAGTAFLHSVMTQERRGMLKVWNMVLVIAMFLLSIFGTFLTRSGIVSSVHAFAQSNIGPFFGVFLAILVVFSVTLLLLRLDFLKSENRLDSVISRESGFLFNNWILLAAVFAVLWGTIFPILSKAVEHVTVTVGPPFFDRVMTPIGLLLLFLTGAGPLLAWRRTSWDSLKRTFAVPMAIAVVTGIILYLAGVHKLYSWMSLFLCAFVASSVLGEFYKGVRTRMKFSGENPFQALYNLTMRNTRRYGGYIVHLGIVMLFVGFAGLAFKREAKAAMGPGDLLRIKNYVLRCDSLKTGSTPNYDYETASLAVIQNGHALGVLKPQKRLYIASQQPISHIAIHSTLAEDLYVVLVGRDQGTGKAVIQAFVNPLVSWVWLGGAIVFLGSLLALIPSRVEREMDDLRKPQAEVAAKKHAD